MSLQTIINKAESIQFDRRRVVGVQYTRSELPKITETVTKNPWKLAVKLSAVFPYADARSLIEAIDQLDRTTSSSITFSNNANLSWLCAYDHANQLSLAQVAALSISAASGKNITLTNLPTSPAYPTTRYLFRAGDFVQIASLPHPFTVTADVLRGSSATVSVPLHRPVDILLKNTGNTIANTVLNQGITVGNAVNFRVFCPNMPTYSIVPGRLVQFEDTFQLFEDLGPTS
jgi:hypothetical protein